MERVPKIKGLELIAKDYINKINEKKTLKKNLLKKKVINYSNSQIN